MTLEIYLHKAIIIMQQEDKEIFHHIAVLVSGDVIRTVTHNTAADNVYVETAYVGAQPGSHFPKIGLNQLYLGLSVPTNDTKSKSDAVDSEVDTEVSDAGVWVTLTSITLGLYLKIIIEALTIVYANNVPMDINSTSFSRSKRSAIIADSSPDMIKLHRGTCVLEFTFPKKLKRSPSTAMAYIHLGKENNDPNRVVVIPQIAPTDTTYFTQCMPIPENASGSAAFGLIS